MNHYLDLLCPHMIYDDINTKVCVPLSFISVQIEKSPLDNTY